MPVEEGSINNIMSGIENAGGIKQHNHKKKLRQRFDIIRKLGQGTFGKVQLGINKETGQEVAIKTIKKSKIESEADLIRIRREIQIMSSVQHPNIIHIYEVFENKEKMVLVMEYAAGGELYDYLSERKVLPEVEARRIFRQIATACYYCHKHKICHRDLKLENILLDENNNAKIADFGLSNVFDEHRKLDTFCGSPLYASPEIVKGKPYLGPEVDCWSLGVLLYTLVYGAMPFDGSNFKKLVRQISNGDYFEPSQPSPASPLIREMLTVDPKQRANIEKICSHWWVNETYDESCLDISEELANQTPVRLDLLLSLAPPPPQLESDKLVVTGDVAEDTGKAESVAPTRSQSVGSLMDLAPAERRIIDLLTEEKSPKRKLENTLSTDRVNLDKSRKEKITKENTIADITMHGAIKESSMEDASMSEAPTLNKSLTQTLSKEMDFEQAEEPIDPSAAGAACAEIIEEAENKEKKQKSKSVKNIVDKTISEEVNEKPETVALDKENIVAQETTVSKTEEPESKPKKKLKKKVLADKNENSKLKTSSPQPENKAKSEITEKEKDKVEDKEKEKTTEEVPQKPVERRRSRIFEAAEKFQNMLSPTENKPQVTEKPKKIVIPGVSVGGFKKEFERKASLTSSSPPKVKGPTVKKVLLDKQSSDEKEKENTEAKASVVETPINEKTEDDRKERVRNAVNIISSALDKEGTRKSKSRPCMMRKPPVPFGASGRSASGNIGLLCSSPVPNNLGPKPFVKQEFDKPEVKQVEDHPEQPPEEEKTSSAEITLKSATLPRRKTTKAQIQLNYPMPKATMEFKTEMAHNVEAQKQPTQRSEVIVPVKGAANIGFRATSAEPPTSQTPKERIIPIAFEKRDEGVQSPPAKPPVARPFQTQKSQVSQRSNSLSRQSTLESDTETVNSTGEPIRKSPREYIIPIAVEGGGYVTPRAGSLEPSDSANTTSTMASKTKSKFGRRRLNERDSEDESPFSNLHRHSSFGRDSDNEDSRKDMFHMHKLRSSRPKKSTLEHNDSLSSGEEDDDEGFEILTAENLFSTLLSRVRDLTQRLNVEDGMRPGFPSSRLLSHFDHGTNFFKRLEPLSRHSSLGRTFSRDLPSNSNNSSSSNFATPWRRSVSRDLASDIDSVFSNANSRPRGDNNKSTKNEDNLNLTDLDLKKLKLSEEDALALSYLTPGLSKRIQKQLLSQLAPSEARKLQRTLSSRTDSENNNLPPENKFQRRSVDRLSSTLPRRFSLKEDSDLGHLSNDRSFSGQPVSNIKQNSYKSSLPIPKIYEKPSYNFSLRSSSTGAEPRGQFRRTCLAKSSSIRESRPYSTCLPTSLSPDSSMSESTSINDSSSYKKETDTSISDNSKAVYLTDPTTSRYYKRYVTPSRSYDNSNLEKTESSTKKPSRRISRFLRPDFYDTPREESTYVKEKKDREMETQKVLKEIRDKRKSRLSMRRERSLSKEKQISEHIANETSVQNNETNGNTNIKKEGKINDYVNVPSTGIVQINGIVNNINQEKQVLHDYVNVPALVSTNKVNNNVENVLQDNFDKDIHFQENISKESTPTNLTTISENNTESQIPILKHERASKIARPKSYPNEEKKISPEKESKISKLRKGFTRQSSKEKETKSKDDKNDNNEAEKTHKNKLIQSIEKKLEKFKMSNNNGRDAEELKALQEKKSTVENAIKRLREQSLPRNLEASTESGLIKRAVSVEDLTTNKPLQASRKSVTKILGLFKKYEEPDEKKKPTKEKKAKSSKDGKSKVKKDKNKEKETTESVILSNIALNPVNYCEKAENQNFDNANNNTGNQLPINSSRCDDIASKIDNGNCPTESTSDVNDKKSDRPRSLLFDKMRHFQNAYNGARSDSYLFDDQDKESKVKSKLPINSYRRSLNLENLPEPPKFYKNPVVKNSTQNTSTLENVRDKPDKKSLRLDFSKIPTTRVTPSTSSCTLESNPTSKHSFNTTDDNSNSTAFLSPCEDNMSDTWSICSDYQHTHDLYSPISPSANGLYSGDEGESVIDRIRRKSFYTRFNEKKKPRRTISSRNYNDLDTYYSNRKSPEYNTFKNPDYIHHKTPDYSSLDRRYDYRSPASMSSSSIALSNSNKRGSYDYKPYTRSMSLVNDYVNVPNRYQTYSSKIGRPSSTIGASSMYSDSEDILDDLLPTTARSRIYSPHLQPSRLSRTSVSPVSELLFDHSSTDSNANPI